MINNISSKSSPERLLNNKVTQFLERQVRPEGLNSLVRNSDKSPLRFRFSFSSEGPKPLGLYFAQMAPANAEGNLSEDALLDEFFKSNYRAIKDQICEHLYGQLPFKSYDDPNFFKAYRLTLEEINTRPISSNGEEKLMQISSNGEEKLVEISSNSDEDHRLGMCEGVQPFCEFLQNIKNMISEYHLNNVLSRCFEVMSNDKKKDIEKMEEICTITNPTIKSIYFLMKCALRTLSHGSNDSFNRILIRDTDWVEHINENIRPLFKKIVEYRMLVAKYFKKETDKILNQLSQSPEIIKWAGPDFLFSIHSRDYLFETANDLIAFREKVINKVFLKIKDVIQERIKDFTFSERDFFEIGIGRKDQCCPAHDFLYQKLPQLSELESSLDGLVLFGVEKIGALKKFAHEVASSELREEWLALFSTALQDFQKAAPELLPMETFLELVQEPTKKRNEPILKGVWSFKVSSTGGLLGYKQISV